jgi:hypothetical protein
MVRFNEGLPSWGGAREPMPADVVLICLSGGMNQSAGNELIKRGYLRVRDLDVGMQA